MKTKTKTKKQPKPNFTYQIKENASSIWNISINKMESFLPWPHLLSKGFEAMVFLLELMANFGIEQSDGAKNRNLAHIWFELSPLILFTMMKFNLSLAFIHFSYSSSSKTPKLIFLFIPCFFTFLGNFQQLSSLHSFN